MTFTESTKLAVKQRAHFACCLCHALGVEVHHIVPQAAGGSDDEDNAAPLCPSCHEVYGANPVKRKFIRETRDFWYDLCDRRYGTDDDRLDHLAGLLREAVTKADLASAVGQISELISLEVRAANDWRNATPLTPGSLLDAEVAATSLRTFLRALYPGVRHCGPEELDRLVYDVRQVGIQTIAELNEMLRDTAEPFHAICREKRDEGENMDNWTDSFPVRLFLAVFDEEYCEIHYPNVLRKYRGKRWLRPKRPGRVSPAT